jgi:hypothetical protein
MTTRFDARSTGLKSGYDRHDYSTEFSIPSCGIEDVDVAVFNLFNKEIPLQVNSKDGLEKVHVIFAAGEKWAVIKKKKEIRNRQGRLILPLITVGRTAILQDPTKDIAGRGVNQQTGEIVIQRRLDFTDRSQQNLTNRLFIRNQMNAAVTLPHPEQLSTLRTIGGMSNDAEINAGALLKPPDLRSNIWETIIVPTPQFFSAKYEVTFWTQYTTHMNQLMEMMLSAQLPQGNAFKIANPNNNGYWFIATIDNNEYTPENNFDDMVEKDRIIKYKFNMTVPGYVLASEAPGVPVPIRKYVSSTAIDFKTIDVDVAGVNVSAGTEGVKNPWLGADDPTLPFEHDMKETFRSPDLRRDGYRLLDNRSEISQSDPALQSYRRGVQPDRYLKIPVKDALGNVTYRYVKATTYNSRQGEASFKPSLGELSIVVTDD